MSFISISLLLFIFGFPADGTFNLLRGSGDGKNREHRKYEGLVPFARCGSSAARDSNADFYFFLYFLLLFWAGVKKKSQRRHPKRSYL